MTCHQNTESTQKWTYIFQNKPIIFMRLDYVPCFIKGKFLITYKNFEKNTTQFSVFIVSKLFFNF